MTGTGERQPVVRNRKARHDYFIESTTEAGLVLHGTEVKSLRQGRASLADAWAADKDGEIWMYNSHIQEYEAGNAFNHHPTRPRKLLLRKRESERFAGLIRRAGMTLIPLSVYFNARGLAKVELGLARGKRQYDKRETEKRRDWNRQKARLLRGKGQTARPGPD